MVLQPAPPDVNEPSRDRQERSPGHVHREEVGQPGRAGSEADPGQDEREEKEVEAEPKRVVLAPVNPPEVAAQVEAAAEPGLEEIPATPDLAQGEQVPAVSAADLEAKYAFDKAEEKAEQA